MGCFLTCCQLTEVHSNLMLHALYIGLSLTTNVCPLCGVSLCVCDVVCPCVFVQLEYFGIPIIIYNPDKTYPKVKHYYMCHN